MKTFAEVTSLLTLKGVLRVWAMQENGIWEDWFYRHLAVSLCERWDSKTEAGKCTALMDVRYEQLSDMVI